ncbi:hypothetical protein J40TS1_07920 [Paenibacillus montaniterrae]|uniref:Uncharacterized protein n=1 Tax=Paenibacillus montaniterrae TaxID=429341 RepID=A0A919YKJ4_9BACL|nr:hypothetical protein [Paenibacillus montaniterrae]GIP15150.1 hypothetical protein J40TS1_07920 [Paenibacillus montaniterrae]
MKQGFALVKGMLAALIVMLLVLSLSRYLDLPASRDEHLAAMTYHKREPLTNENLVDVLSEHINTSTLKAIRLQHERIDVDLLLHSDQPVHEQIYDTVPLYVALAFHYGSNIEQLSITVLREGRKHGETLQLMQLTVRGDDAWLEQGVQALEGVAWLEQPLWIERLRIHKSILWQQHYEV